MWSSIRFSARPSRPTSVRGFASGSETRTGRATSPRSNDRLATSPAVAATRLSGAKARRMMMIPNAVATRSVATVTTPKINATRIRVLVTSAILRPITSVVPGCLPGVVASRYRPNPSRWRVTGRRSSPRAATCLTASAESASRSPPRFSAPALATSPPPTTAATIPTGWPGASRNSGPGPGRGTRGGPSWRGPDGGRCSIIDERRVICSSWSSSWPTR